MTEQVDNELNDALADLKYALQELVEDEFYNDAVKAIDKYVDFKIQRAIEAVYANVQYNPTVG